MQQVSGVSRNNQKPNEAQGKVSQGQAQKLGEFFEKSNKSEDIRDEIENLLQSGNLTPDQARRYEAAYSKADAGRLNDALETYNKSVQTIKQELGPLFDEIKKDQQ